MLMEYIVIPSLRIATEIRMADAEALKERVVQLLQLDEDRFIAGFEQQVLRYR